MEHLIFKRTAEFMAWAKQVNRGKYQRYDRSPSGKQTWTYSDGHIAETEWGKKDGTVLANLAYMLSTATGRLKQAKDYQLVEDIDRRGGVTVTSHARGPVASRDTLESTL